MAIDIQRFSLLVITLLFSILGCTREHSDLSMLDDHSVPMETHEAADIAAAFEQNLLPILTARCGLAGCHVADGPHGLDFRTYQSFIAGGEHGPAFIPGNAEESAVVKEIVSGRMPPGGPPLSDAEVQLFRDWINQQETPDHAVQHKHDDHGDDAETVDDHADDDMDDDADADDDHNDDGHHDMDEDDHNNDGHDDDENGHDDMNDEGEHGNMDDNDDDDDN